MEEGNRFQHCEGAYPGISRLADYVNGGSAREIAGESRNAGPVARLFCWLAKEAPTKFVAADEPAQ